MEFITDKQTLDDLNIFSPSGRSSVYGIFNRTFTSGGASIMEQMFRSPLAREEEIRKRSSIISHFVRTDTAFPFVNENFAAIEEYLNNRDERTQLAGEGQTLSGKLNALIATDGNYKMIHLGLKAIMSTVVSMRRFLLNPGETAETAYSALLNGIAGLLATGPFASLPRADKYKLSYQELAGLDVLLRFENHHLVRQLLDQIYHLDVFISVARVAKSRSYTFPLLTAEAEHRVLLENVYHPELQNAVPNSLQINPEGNLIFLTGANMAGKSTFMKTLGLAVYLAHMGFPVPAERMEFSVFDGIFTTINLSDNLSAGTSHFYAEVLRVKTIAKELQEGKKLFVIIDELFRGTNVKDAHEATVAIATGFAAIPESVFVISTHIVEAAPVLQSACPNIVFKYLPTKLLGNVPQYTYQLENGITDDRHGMVIIHNEQILEILKRRKS
ncbi:MutS-related protein [Pedobacter sp. AW31-3R]|uniref:MutS-related protein n=1 Tax=Pedobacter sp. AW31-3R TaxID=3445781 RepID=UPI003FA1867F